MEVKFKISGVHCAVFLVVILWIISFLILCPFVPNVYYCVLLAWAVPIFALVLIVGLILAVSWMFLYFIRKKFIDKLQEEFDKHYQAEINLYQSSNQNCLEEVDEF